MERKNFEKRNRAYLRSKSAGQPVVDRSLLYEPDIKKKCEVRVERDLLRFRDSQIVEVYNYMGLTNHLRFEFLDIQNCKFSWRMMDVKAHNIVIQLSQPLCFQDWQDMNKFWPKHLKILLLRCQKYPNKLHPPFFDELTKTDDGWGRFHVTRCFRDLRLTPFSHGLRINHIRNP